MKPNYGIWDCINEFTISEAAWLWTDEEPKPNDNDLTPSVLAIHTMFGREVDRGGISVCRDNRGDRLRYARAALVGEHTWPKLFLGPEDVFIARSDLVKLALNKSYKPPFLFSEERGQTSETKLRRIKMMLGLAALAIVDVHKGTRKFGTRESPIIDPISSVINEQLDSLKDNTGGKSPHGLSKRTITEDLNEAFQLLGVKGPNP